MRGDSKVGLDLAVGPPVRVGYGTFPTVKHPTKILDLCYCKSPALFATPCLHEYTIRLHMLLPSLKHAQGDYFCEMTPPAEHFPADIFDMRFKLFHRILLFAVPRSPARLKSYLGLSYGQGPVMTQ